MPDSPTNTSERMQAIFGRLAAASRFERPWHVDYEDDYDIEVWTADSDPGCKTVICQVGQHDADGTSPLAEFLGHAPEDVEWLLAEVGRLTASLDAWRSLYPASATTVGGNGVTVRA